LSRLTIDSLIRDALRREGVYERASKAGWPIGIRFAAYGDPLTTEVTVTCGCAPDQIVLGTAFRNHNESFRPPLDALITQVIGQLHLLL
jgi:hypothetical protein